jgi:hypothetical protein
VPEDEVNRARASLAVARDHLTAVLRGPLGTDPSLKSHLEFTLSWVDEAQHDLSDR